MSDNPKNIKNYLIDFGGVLYKIDEMRSLVSFKKLSSNKSLFEKINIEEFFNQEIFVEYQKGLLSSNQFRKILKNKFELNCNNKEFDKAWNLTLIKPFPNIKDHILKLKRKGRILLISNTNEIHYNHFFPECSNIFNEFEKCYFSHQIGYHKPEKSFFEFVINDRNLNPKESMVLDDTEINIQSAEEIGFQTYLIQNTGLKGFITETETK